MEDGIPNTALREIKALQEIDCEHVVRLREVLPHGSGFVLVFEYMLSDLSEVIRNTDRPLTEAQVREQIYNLNVNKIDVIVYFSEPVFRFPLLRFQVCMRKTDETDKVF